MSARLVLGAVVLCLSALVAEMILPFVLPDLGTMRRLVHHVGAGNYALNPGVEIPFSGMFERVRPAVVWQVNDDGIRAAGPVAPLGDRYRIASYGDSETFGWSVNLDDTLQRQMEAVDPRVEVINLGVPGYNVENIGDHIEATVPRYDPDLILHLVNKNDVDRAIDVSEPVLSSQLLLRIRFFYQVIVTKPWRKQARRSPERNAFLAGQLDRIAAYAEARQVPLLLAFMRSRSWQRARANAAPNGYTATSLASGDDVHRVVDVEDLFRGFSRLDDHLPPEAYRVLAARLCSIVSGGVIGSCVPHGWTRGIEDGAERMASARRGRLVPDHVAYASASRSSPAPRTSLVSTPSSNLP